MLKKILVVDDEADLELLIRQKFRSHISKGEFAFDFALNGELALVKLKSDPGFDLVLTDINMPVMDGLTLLNEIRAMNYSAKTVVVSAYSELKNIRIAMNRGAFDFITKPIELSDLDVTVRKALEEMEMMKLGLEARDKLGVVTLEKETAVLEKLEAQRQMLEALQEKEKLILEQNEMLEKQVAARTVEVLRQKELIEIKNREIIDSIHYAKHVQEAIMPAQGRIHDLFPESFVLYLPKDIVAGDFYWMEHTGDLKILAIADCTGHGVAGALMSMVGMSLLNQLVFEKGIAMPGAMLEQLHQQVVTSLKQQDTNSSEGMDISICTYNHQSGKLWYAGANRSLLLVRNEETIEYHGNKYPVGGLQILHQEPVNQYELTPRPGDSYYLFTDGYADQFGGEQNKKMMTRKFRETLFSIRHLPMQEQRQYLFDFFHAWKGSQEQVDDVLVTGFKF